MVVGVTIALAEATKTEKREERYKKFQQLAWIMSDPKTGIKIEEKRRLLQPVHSCFTAYELVSWICDCFKFETRDEGLLLSNKLYRDGFVFPIFEFPDLLADSDECLMRIQAPFYWPSISPNPSTFEYAVYLVKCNMKKGPGSLKTYEMTAFTQLSESLEKKWEFVVQQSAEQINAENATRTTQDQTIFDSQERSYWYITGQKGPKENRAKLGANITEMQERIVNECNLSENAMKSVKWSKSLMDLLECQEGRLQFAQYVKSEHSEENLNFWEACRKLKSMKGVSDEQIKKNVADIWTMYLAPGAPEECNLSSSVRMRVKQELEKGNYTVDVLEDSIVAIQTLMNKDSYVRFLRSKEYLALVMEYENYQWMII